jgi:hypothetical protein
VAAPYLSLKPVSVGIHLVRNPIQVLRAIVGRSTFKPGGFRMLPAVRFYFRWTPELGHDDEPIVLAMKYWLFWNRMVDRYSMAMFRVEQISASASGELGRLLRFIGAVVDADAQAAALAKYGTTCHTGDRDESVTWDSLPDGELKDAIAEDAIEYGYTQDDLYSGGG